MQGELSKEVPRDSSDAVKDALASRQASAAVTLLKLGHADRVWSLLRTSLEPRLRSYLIHRLAPLQSDPEVLLRQLLREQDTFVRQALLLSLGEYPADRIPVRARQELLARGLDLFRDDPDPGIHSAASWLLRRLGHSQDLVAAEKPLVSKEPLAARRWYINEEGHTLAVIPGPVSFPMFDRRAVGNPPSRGALRMLRLPYSFAIATHELTLGQFRRFLQDNPDIVHEFRQQPQIDERWAATQVTWIQAAKYCRWLSEREQVHPDEMCFPEIKDIKEGMKLPANYLQRTGYRLPTDAEWECACRAGTVTRRYYGSADELMPYYGWHMDNSRRMPQPVGLLKPNDLGLFDMYGNVTEWCSDLMFFSPEVEERVLRGSSRFYQPEEAETARPYVVANRPTYRGNECGMRLARTLPHAKEGS
jgi:formylglycine-generating enzyme required for sulfatase activity